MYDIDSPEDFMRFATDHYGELGLSRLNIFASNDRQQGWKVVVSNSYSVNVGLAIEVATALYKAETPLLIYDAEKLLRWRFRSKGPQKTDDYFGVKPPKKDPIINKKGRALGSRASIFRSIATQLS